MFSLQRDLGLGRPGWTMVWVLAAIWMAVASAGAAEFDSPPEVKDRWVRLTWEPDPDDPVFNGNTVLVPEATYSVLHAPGRSVRLIALRGSGDQLEGLSFAEGGLTIQRWNASTGNLLEEIPLGSPEEPVDLSVHRSGRFLAGALPTGEVEIWDLSAGTAPTIYPASDEPLTQVKFFPNINDPNDLRHVTAGLADSVRVWNGPEDLRFGFRIVDGPTYSIALNRAGTRVVTGGASGNLRAWNITSQPFSPIFRLQGHQAPVTDIDVSQDGQRIASADSSGTIHIWPFRGTTNPLATIETPDLGAPPLIEFSVPNASILYVGLADGTLQLHDGFTGELYRQAEISEDGMTSMVLAPSGARIFSGDNDGVVSRTRAGRCVPSRDNLICFGGYKLWRNTQPDTSGVELLRVYGFGDSTWSFVGELREFVDPESIIIRTGPPTDDPDEEVLDETIIAGPHNGIPYFYSITRFDRHFLNGSVFDVFVNSIQEGFYRDPGATEPTAIVPQARGRGDLPLLENIVVVPNPYERNRAPWEEFGGRHVEFRNLPSEATIRIYSVAGDIIRVLEHGAGRYGESRNTQEWDLRNGRGSEVTSGIYVYQVETPSGEVIQGYLAVIL